MKFNKRLLSFFLAVLMLVSTFGDSVYAISENVKANSANKTTELKGKVKGNKEVFTFELPERQAQRRVRRAVSLNQGNDTIVNLKTVGLNGGDFDWSSLPDKEFKLTAKWKTEDGQEHSKVFATINAAGESQHYVGWPVDGTLQKTASIEADFDQNIKIRVTYDAGTGNGIPGGLLFNITITELAEPRANVQYVDPYGRPITDAADLPAADATMPKVTADGLTGVEIDLPKSSEEINMRDSEFIDEDELNKAADGLSFKVDGKTTGEKVTIGKKEYKLEISEPNAKKVGTIKMVYQKDVLVPPTKDDGNPVDPAEGYVRLTFDANENKQDGITGTHKNGLYAGKQKSYIDVKEGVQYDNQTLQAAIKELATTGTKTVNGQAKEYTQDAKNPWSPTVPTDTTKVAKATYNAQYTKSAAEQVQELGGLKPVTIKVWKGDRIDWSKGVAPKTTDEKDAAVIQSLLDNAEVTEITEPARTSDAQGKFKGKLLVTFGDKSTLEVDEQWLYVWEHIVTVDPNSTDPDVPKKADDLPRDKVKVLFEAKPNGGVESIKTKGTTYAKNGTVFQEKDFPQDITFKDGYKGPVTWTPKDHTITTKAPAYNKAKGAFVFRASATKNTKADQVTELGGLKAKDIAVWVKDQITWANGVEAKDAAKKAEIEALLQGATVEDLSNRNSDKKGEYPGKLKVTFDDKSTLEVDNQMLYVYANGDEKPEDGKPVPTDAATVTFTKDDNSIKADGWDTVKPIIVKKGTKVPAEKFPNAEAKEGYKSVTWTPAKDTVVNDDQAFNAKAAKDTPTTADKDNYDPHYTGKSGKPGTTVNIPAPTFTKKGEQGTVPAPTNGDKKTTFTKNDPNQTNVTVDPNTGAITVKIPADAQVGSKITIPVDVTYPDGSKETVEVTVTVVDNGQPRKPTIENPAAKNEKGKDSTTVTGKTDPNTKVTVTDEKGNKIGEGTSDPDGNFTIETNPKQEKGKKVTLTPEGGDGIKVTVTEDDTPDDKPSAPSITWRGLWFLGGKTETSKEMETGRHYKYLYGYVDKTVRPEGMITRSEAAALIARLANLDMSDKTKPNFKDTPSAWYNSAINAMVSRNLMFADKNGNFRPNEPITRGEFARALYYIDKKNDKVAPFADVKGHEFEEAINQAYGNGRIAGYQDGTFKPNANIQRAEAARILNQYADRNVNLVGMANVKRDLVRFTDINESHWAYCEVMEAANSHEYQREKGTLAETWLRILDK